MALTKLAPAALTLAGAVLLSIGVALVFLPAGLIVGGALATAAGLFVDYGDDQ